MSERTRLFSTRRQSSRNQEHNIREKFEAAIDIVSAAVTFSVGRPKEANGQRGGCWLPEMTCQRFAALPGPLSVLPSVSVG